MRQFIIRWYIIIRILACVAVIAWVYVLAALVTYEITDLLGIKVGPVWERALTFALILFGSFVEAIFILGASVPKYYIQKWGLQ